MSDTEPGTFTVTIVDETRDAAPPPGSCGNGWVEGTEMCDLANLNGETCSSATLGHSPDGVLACSSSCTFDVSGCFGAGGGSGIGGMAGFGGLNGGGGLTGGGGLSGG